MIEGRKRIINPSIHFILTKSYLIRLPVGGKMVLLIFRDAKMVASKTAVSVSE